MTSSFSQLGLSQNEIAVILVDHGSRRDESNELLLQAVEAYQQYSNWQIVEPAHMELAEPSIATAFGRCAERGAQLVVVFPYLLSPGRHWDQDIPSLTAEAAQAWAGVRYLVTAPFGLHELMMQVIDERIHECLQQVDGSLRDP